MLFSELFTLKLELLPLQFYALQFNSFHTDSRKVNTNDVFLAQKGFTTNSHQYILEVLDKGAFVVKNTNEDIFIPKQYENKVINVPCTHTILPFLAKAFFGFPDESMTIIGITGTNGKTTITTILHHLLSLNHSMVGLIGTIHNKIGSQSTTSINTTPDAYTIYELLAQMKTNYCQAVILEISSHALDLHRVSALSLDIAAFTNFSLEHLDFHKDLDNYLQAKLKIFDLLKNSPKKNKLAIVNTNIYHFHLVQQKLTDLNLPYKTFEYKKGIKQENNPNKNHYIINTLQSNIHSTTFSLYNDHSSLILETNLQGQFNTENLCIVYLCYSFLNYNMNIFISEIKNLSIKGRFENITPHLPYSVIVDYAHSPDALKNVLITAKELNPNKLIVVFGCGGNRDKSKRPVMGKIATEIADISIITSDNPRYEDPDDIIEDIKQGIVNFDNVLSVTERKEAIKKGLTLLDDGDILLITGKGHETYQIFKSEVLYFSDQDTVINLLKEN